MLQGFQFIPGEFTHNPDPDIGIRNAVNWQSQQLFLVEFDNTTENTLDAFITARPFLQQHAWLVTDIVGWRSVKDTSQEKQIEHLAQEIETLKQQGYLKKIPWHTTETP